MWMASLSDNRTIGRQPITIVEIDQDRCALTYGTAPCTAALGVTGAHKCYNTFRTCQDPDNIDLGTLTLRFSDSMESTGLPKTMVVIPSLLSVDTVPTEINVGGGSQGVGPLGQRAKVTATFRDHPYHDRLVDKYWRDRDFDPAIRSTFWAKWLARNPYHQGRALRVREGYVGQALEDMRVRHYVIDRIDGPDKDVVKVIAKDPLKLLDSERAQVPLPSGGELDAAIDENDMALTLAPSGIGNSEYPASGIARIGSELVSYTRSGDSVTITARALRGTTAESHEEGDTFQHVYVVDSVRIDLALQELMTVYAPIPPAFIPVADWEAEATLWLSGFNVSTWITEPTGIGTVVGDLVEQALCVLWWDEVDQQIKFRAVRPYYPRVDALPISVTDRANIVADSVGIENRPDERISQVMVYYAQINPTGAKDDVSNYARRRVIIDQESEEPEQYGDKRIKTIFANWLDEANDASAVVVASRIIERYRDPPKVVKFSADAKDDAIRVGRVINFAHRGIVDFQGEVAPTLLQIMSSREVQAGHRIDFVAQPYLSRTRYGIIMANDAPVYGAATDSEKQNGCWIAPGPAGFANDDLPYRIL
jgi:hypothetical protein